MKKHIFLVSIIVVILGAGWFWYGAIRRADKRTAQPQSASGTASAKAPEPDSAHELMALGEQLKRKPGHAPVLFRMAELERTAGRHKEAAAHLREILRTEPGNSEALLELGRSLYEAGDVQAALAETRKLVEKEPKNVDALYNLGAIYGNLNDLETARRYWAQAVEAAPNSESGAKARSALAQTSMQAGAAHR